jgi:ribosomal protein S18 acetylase RimI-like enzyme
VIDGVTLRPATRSDAAEIALLVNIATHGLVSDDWAARNTPGTHSPIEAGRLSVMDDETFSWRKATMAVSGDEVVGMLLGARDPDVPPPLPDDLPRHLTPFFELATYAPGAWFISMLAVHVTWRGKGIGSVLLDLAEQKRDETAARGLSLFVEDINEGARRLYQSRGFAVRATRPVIPFPSGGPKGGVDWLLMVKE